MSTDPRWTEDAAALVAKAVRKGFVPFGDSSFNPRLEATAEVVLTALADAGLLLPRDVDRDEQRGVLNPQTGQVSRCPGRDCEHTEDEQRRARVRTVVSFTTPWTEVETGSQS